VPHTELRGEGLLLRPCSLDDEAGIAEAGRAADIRAMPWFGEGFVDAWALPWVERAAAEWQREGGHRVFSVIGDDDTGDAGRFLGSLVAAAPEGDAIELAYWVVPAARGHRVTSRAVRVLLPWLRSTEPGRRVWAKTDPANRASQASLLGAGFTETGRGEVVVFEAP
jgi:RimJ/RimL family protein N-acetyltransferase